MSNPITQKPEVDEPVHFANFKASLRISGDGLDLDEISRTLGLTPTTIRRKGATPGSPKPPREHDLWLYTAPVARDRPLDEHIMALWNAVRPQIPYLRELKQRFHVDIFCGYRSNSCTGGFNVDHRCLGIFSELDIPFGVSVIIS
jgi:hypothetical protein